MARRAGACACPGAQGMPGARDTWTGGRARAHAGARGARWEQRWRAEAREQGRRLRSTHLDPWKANPSGPGGFWVREPGRERAGRCRPRRPSHRFLTTAGREKLLLLPQDAVASKALLSQALKARSWLPADLVTRQEAVRGGGGAGGPGGPPNPRRGPQAGARSSAGRARGAVVTAEQGGPAPGASSGHGVCLLSHGVRA